MYGKYSNVAFNGTLMLRWRSTNVAEKSQTAANTIKIMQHSKNK